MNIIDDVLLSKFLAGEATPEEAIRVNTWIEFSEENRERYSQAERLWTMTAIGKDLPQTALGLRSFKRTRFVRSYRYAAVAAILLMFSVTAVLYKIQTPNRSVVAWEIKQTRNEIAALNLPDGSSVVINRQSVMKWRKGLAGTSRDVVLAGEAFFDVKHDDHKPFVVSIGDVKIRVLGTAFNVHNRRQEGVVQTSVVRGKVMMYTAQKQIIIDAGMTGIYKRKTNELLLMKLKNENSLAYATHSLSFSAAPLLEVSNELSKAYEVKFVFENANVLDCRLTTEYHNKSLPFIMDVIAESLGLSYTIKGNIVYISGDGCLSK